MRIAAYRQYNDKIPANVECCKTGKMKRDYGVEIHIDDLSEEEIIDYIDQENFNSLQYIKQDYFNFKTYINAETFPRHMDYMNNDCAPDLLKFMSTRIGGRKTTSYYEFLTGIDEERLPALFLKNTKPQNG